ncbi:MAG: nascent polypeptide-associated complex protein [Promethearchaeota archaeon]
MVRPPKKPSRQKGKGASKRMQRMMKNMEEISATKVIMTLDDGGGILLESPQVIKLTVQGQETWQIIGESESLSPDEMKELLQEEKEAEEEFLEISEEDIILVASQTGVNPEEARAALQQAGGEPARAILLLKG